MRTIRVQPKMNNSQRKHLIDGIIVVYCPIDLCLTKEVIHICPSIVGDGQKDTEYLVLSLRLTVQNRWYGSVF